MATKQEILGQYFTKPVVVEKLLDLLFTYTKLPKSAKILEPSSGTGNFVKALKARGFKHITECEVDSKLNKRPSDFFDLSLNQKFDLIIGNPPFSKFNLPDSYYQLGDHLKSPVMPSFYLAGAAIKKPREKIENVFIWKAIKHLKNKNSTIAFILPISFFIKNKNKLLKTTLEAKFSTVIIYQNSQIWFDRDIPCGFLILGNIAGLKNKIVTVFENGQKYEEVFSLDKIHEELIPRVIFHKNHGYINNEKGAPLKEFLINKKLAVQKSFTNNNVSAKNILTKAKIPTRKKVEDFQIAVVRVGNSSVGKAGLVDIKRDVLNDMFYVFEFKPPFNKNRQIKEKICREINNNLDYFQKITYRVGSKSIKKEDLLNLKVLV